MKLDANQVRRDSYREPMVVKDRFYRFREAIALGLVGLVALVAIGGLWVASWGPAGSPSAVFDSGSAVTRAPVRIYHHAPPVRPDAGPTRSLLASRLAEAARAGVVSGTLPCASPRSEETAERVRMVQVRTLWRWLWP